MSNFKSQLKEAFGNLKRVFVRYPMACVSAIVLSVQLSRFFYYALKDINCIDFEWPSPIELFFALLLGSFLSILLCFTADLFCHLRKEKLPFRILWNVVAVALAAAGGKLLYANFHSNFVPYYVFTSLFVALMLLLAVPTLGYRNSRMTWNYHIRLLFAILLGDVVAHILVMGMVAIILSIFYLFHIDFNSESIIYALGIANGITIGLLLPCCVMALMPIDKESYDRPLIYNKFMKIIIQYILLTLVCIEAVVLYLFALKTLIQWELPQGKVAYLVFSYAIIGTIVWYLLKPVFCSEQPTKMKYLEKGYFVSLIPLLVLLFVGLFRRIHDYGFTANRYLVLVGACWFMVVSVIMLFRKSKSTNLALLTLPVIAVLLLFGPWSMFSLPERIQLNRFEKIATEYHLLENGKIVTPAEPLTQEQNVAISEIMDFFSSSDLYMCDLAERYFGYSYAEAEALCKEAYLESKLFTQMKAIYFNDFERDMIKNNQKEEIAAEPCFFQKEADEKLYKISGYDYAFPCDQRGTSCHHGAVKVDVKHEGPEWGGDDLFHFNINGDTFVINVIDSLSLNYNYPRGKNGTLSTVSIIHEDAHLKFYMDVSDISLYDKDPSDNSTARKIGNIHFYGFVKMK